MVVLLIRSLEAIFVVGLVGSALVVVLTTIDDVRELLLKSEGEHRDLEQKPSSGAPPVVSQTR